MGDAARRLVLAKTLPLSMSLGTTDKSQFSSFEHSAGPQRRGLDGSGEGWAVDGSVWRDGGQGARLSAVLTVHSGNKALEVCGKVDMARIVVMATGFTIAPAQAFRCGRQAPR